MKLSTFKNRTSKFSSNSRGYQLALEVMRGTKCVLTCWTSGSGRFTKNMDYTADTIHILNVIGLIKGIDFVLENDSPGGGKTGNHITLTAKGRRKMIK